ncbi:MAG: uridine kinase [Longimicrobiales bacterium]|nr:uridine kinase [Longimicrobiales bacterium]
MAATARPVVLGVAGGSGSGKSTVVREVCRALGGGMAAVLHHDSYYRDLARLPFGERANTNFDHPAALETELMVDHIRLLVEGVPVELPTYDFSTHTRSAATQLVRPTPVVVLDGILVLADSRLRDTMDLRVFVDTEAEVRLLRRIRRDVARRGRTADAVIAQYEATVRPMHLEFVEPSKRYADLVVPEGGHNRLAVDQVVARLRSLLAARSAVAGA